MQWQPTASSPETRAVTVADLNLRFCSIQEAVGQIGDAFQVDYVTVHLFRSGEDAQNKPYVRTNYPGAWVTHYLLNDYVRIDPVFAMAEQTAGPFCWSTITPRGAQIEMMEKAASFCLGGTGFSVRHVDSIERRSVLSFKVPMAAALGSRTCPTCASP